MTFLQPSKSSARAVGYVRVSKEEQRLSPEAQREHIAAWSAHNGVPVLDVFNDIGVKSEVRPHDRPGFSLMLDFIREHKIDFVVVSAHDRVARDLMYAVLVDAELKSLKPACRIVTAVENPDDAETPEKTVLTQITQVFSQYERSKIRQRTKAAVAKAREQGRVPGPKKWETLPRGVATIQLVKFLVDAQWTQKRIALYLAQNEVLSPHGGVLTTAHVRKCAQSELRFDELATTREELVQRVKCLAYFESKFTEARRERDRARLQLAVGSRV